MADEAPSLAPPPSSASLPPPTVMPVSAPPSDSVAETEEKELPPPPPPSEPVISSSGSPQTTDNSNEVATVQSLPPPAPADVGLSETDSQSKEEKAETAPPPSQPQVVTLESRSSLAAMMEKEEAAVESEVTEKSMVLTPPKTASDSNSSEQKKIPQNLVSFKEESNKWTDLSDSERKSLQELKQLLQEAIENHQFEDPEKKPENGSILEEVSIWGIPLLKDERSDVICLKFLRARDFKMGDAFAMIKNAIKWRRRFRIDELLSEELGDDLEKVVFMHGKDREGHPVCYNLYGEFQNKELYHNTFSDEEKRSKFLRWRIQFLERSIRKLDFNPGGISTIFQVNDLKNSPGPGKRELRLATKQALLLLQDNYPEFVAKQVFINVPWWYLAFYTMISPFMTQRTKSKFVFAGPSRTAETLFKYIPPEHVPVQYGGLSVDYCDCNTEFSIDDPATEIVVKPGTKQTVEISIYERCVIVWELRVVGWEVSYGAEFVPDTKGSYIIIIQKPIKMAPTDEPVVCQNFKVGELGKILLKVDNPTSKRKKLIYRFKVKPLSD